MKNTPVYDPMAGTPDALAHAINCADIALQKGDWSALAMWAERAVRAAPGHAMALQWLAHALDMQGRCGDALVHWQAAAHSAPLDAQACYNYAVALSLAGEKAAAVVQYQAALRANPDHTDALWNYSELLRLSEHFAMAATCLERLLALGQYFKCLHHRLGVCYAALNHPDAEAQLLMSVAKKEDELTRWELAHYYLARQRFSEGWDAYAGRFDGEPGHQPVIRHFYERTDGVPLWDGAPLGTATLLVHGEQGIGDELMFASIVPDLLQAHPQTKVVLAVFPTLHRLFTENFADYPQVKVVPHLRGNVSAQLDSLPERPVAHLPIGNLAALFRRRAEDFPGIAWLRTPAHIDGVIGQKLALLLPPAPGLLTVGLCWGSNPSVRTQHARQRNIPADLLARQLALPTGGMSGVRYVSVLNSDRAAELGCGPELQALDFSPWLTDMADTAQLLQRCDIVVTVCTSLAHLSASLGRETWVLLQHHHEWRWAQERTDSYWYPQVRLFRQAEPGDWAGVLRDVAATLRTRVQ
ncbi:MULTISPECIES: tetratricopeptide repeat-containing glycosyltransferase family protein [unclassified Polaromonas]|uniref:tetratricopeptide repeat-containing glycosyltransferase family protein n=1 Tax=unclassified Polaromonas TaxID=2638319 RepID=UPI000F097CC8|nr:MULTISPECIES: tetratricopeptide repeat-containing glycosyltransferase family protein [unclassified Polaromonas]AYQ30272.1 hypothetical protein DT070_21025 [Polaromonas sp. SP1]QGJ18613.1 hypothetical protein F7R28_09560 [Polaromonas sp. Pch-P]